MLFQPHGFSPRIVEESNDSRSANAPRAEALRLGKRTYFTVHVHFKSLIHRVNASCNCRFNSARVLAISANNFSYSGDGAFAETRIAGHDLHWTKVQWLMANHIAKLTSWIRSAC
jgi:hypothetical protein